MNTTQHQHHTDTAPATDASDPDVLHIVDGFWEAVVMSWLSRSRWLPRRLRPAPRALCGVAMWGGPGYPDPAPSRSPHCPDCLEIAGLDPDTADDHLEYVPGW